MKTAFYRKTADHPTRLRNSKSIISLFFTVILTAGMICSGIHLDELGNIRHAHSKTDTQHTVEKNHDHCPVCAVKNKSEDPVEIHLFPDLFTVDTDPVPFDRITVNKRYAAKYGRAPPFLVDYSI